MLNQRSSAVQPGWPIYFKNILRVGNLTSNVGVVTLWTERDVIEKQLDKKDYAAIGNLYAAAGINHMMRNIFANPNIRYLIIWGADMSQSGHALTKFIQKGIDDKYQIIDARGEIEKEIPKNAIEEFRKNVQVIDLRGKPMGLIKDTIKKLPKREAFAKKPRIFPPAKPAVSQWPSESVGFRAEGDTVAQVWLKILNLIQRYGKTEKTRYASNNKLKEILNLTAIINKEDPDKEYLPHYLPFSMAELKAYYPEMMTSRKIPGSAYNYGDRMRNQIINSESDVILASESASWRRARPGSGNDSGQVLRQAQDNARMTFKPIDQIKEIIHLLKRRPFSKKGFAVLYRVDDWKKVDTSDTPCMTQLHARITQNKLFLTSYFRSQDMFHGWPRNAFAIRKVQKEIADAVDMPLGPLTIITMSAHMYADDWKTAETILSESYLNELQYLPRFPHLILDKRGNWFIDIEYDTQLSKINSQGSAPRNFYNAPAHTRAVKNPDKSASGNLTGKIIAKLFPDERMQTPLITLEGRSAKEVYWQIVDWEIMSLPSHIFSIGEELAKAEIALRLGIEFKMDAPLDFSIKVKRTLSSRT